jgi:hypothetical protein
MNPLFRELEAVCHFSPGATSKPLGKNSRNGKDLKLWQETFTESSSDDYESLYLSSFDQYKLSKQFSDVTPHKRVFIPLSRFHSLHLGKILIPVKRITRLIRELPIPVSKREEKQRVFEKLDHLSHISFFDDYLSLTPKEYKEIKLTISSLCSKELGKDFLSETISAIGNLPVSSIIKDQRENLGPLFEKAPLETSLVTKTGLEGVRQGGLYHLLAALNLHKTLIPSKRLNDRIVMPHLPLQTLRLQEASKDDLAEIAVVHALLHVQDGGKVNVRLTKGKRVVCFDLARALLPKKTVSYPNIEQYGRMGNFLTLNTLFFEKKYREIGLPKHLVEKLKSEEWMDAVRQLKLKHFLTSSDPIRKDEAQLLEAERQFKERAKALHELAKEKADLTVQEIFDALYPDEMLFIYEAENQKVSTKDIDTLYLYRSDKAPLRQAYQNLTQSRINLTEYARFHKISEVT